MRVIILTESIKGTAAHHLPVLLQSPHLQVVQVVRSRGVKLNKRKFLLKKIKKSFAIGPLGVLNGFRMRKWFGAAVDERLQLESLDKQCQKYSIPYAEVDITNSEQTKELFKKANADIGISLGNSFISKKVFSIPRYGMVNIHHEILPDYRNAQSIIWQLYNGSAVTGYTIHRISSQIDGGDILYQEKVPIRFEDSLPGTIASTSVDLLKASAKGLVALLENFLVYASAAVPQQGGHEYTTPTAGQFSRIMRNYKELRKKHGQ